MMFGFNQFFQFGFQQPNIDPILERAEGIDDILDEDNITTIVKSSTGSEKFGEYTFIYLSISIRKHPEMIYNLIKYITEEPELHEQMDQKRCFKYPFVSSELFSCEIPLLINSLFDDLRLVSTNNGKNDEEEEDEEEEKQDNEFNVLARQIPKERVSGKQEQEAEEIIEQIDIQCEGEDDDETKNEFLETENHEKETKDAQIEQYVDEVIKNVVQQLKKPIVNGEQTLQNGVVKPMQEEEAHTNNNEIVGIKLMQYLLAFISTTNELNETSAGYWAKVITSIINKRGTDFMDYLAESASHFFDEMLNFVSCRSIADIILKLVLLEVPSLEAKKILYYQQRTQLVKKLQEKLTTSTNTYELENIAYVLSEIFNKYPNQYNGSQELVEFILTEENINRIFRCIINQKDQSLYIYSLKVLESIFKFFSQPEENQQNQQGFLGSSEKTDNKDEEIRQNLQQLLTDSKLQDCFQQNLSELIGKINEQQQITDEIVLQFSQKVKPFGLGRLKIIEIVYLGIKNQLLLGTSIIEQTLKTTDFFNIIMKLAQQYEWNNFLHTQIEKLLLLILQSTTPIRSQLFTPSCNLLDLIILTLSSLHFQISTNRPYRTTHGNIMLFIKLSNEIMNLKKKGDEFIVSIIDGHTKWEGFCEQVMDKINKEMTQDLGGVNPREKKPCVSENDREIDLANIFKKFSAFFSNSNSMNQAGTSSNDNNNEDDAKKKDDDDDNDNDYNQLNKKYLDQDEEGEENNDDPNEEGTHPEPKENEKISLQKLKLQQLTAGGAVTASKAKNERNVAYAAYALKKNKEQQQQQEDFDENEEENCIQDQFNKNVQEKQQRLLKEAQQQDDEDDFLNEQLQLETQKQLDHEISKPLYNSYQYWERDEYKQADISEEMIDELL